MTWRVETLNDKVDEELDSLPADMRARFTRTCQLISTVGLEQIGGAARPARDRTAPGIASLGPRRVARTLYVAASGRRVVLVRVFVKKTRRTPRREIELALRRAREALQ